MYYTGDIFLHSSLCFRLMHSEQSAKHNREQQALSQINIRLKYCEPDSECPVPDGCSFAASGSYSALESALENIIIKTVDNH